MCEGISGKTTKNVRERDVDGWEGRRKDRERDELGEDSIWEGSQSVVAEIMKGMRV